MGGEARGEEGREPELQSRSAWGGDCGEDVSGGPEQSPSRTLASLDQVLPDPHIWGGGAALPNQLLSPWSQMELFISEVCPLPH